MLFSYLCGQVLGLRRVYYSLAENSFKCGQDVTRVWPVSALPRKWLLPNYLDNCRFARKIAWFDSPSEHISRPFQIRGRAIFIKGLRESYDLLTVKELRNVGISSHDKYGYSFPLYQVISALSASLQKHGAAPQSCHFHRHWRHPGWPDRLPFQSIGRDSVLQLFSLFLKHFPGPGGQPHYTRPLGASFALE